MGLDDNTARPEPADESVALTPDQQLLTEIRDLLREQRA
jgi:large-conductance mechanosensitive channel